MQTVEFSLKISGKRAPQEERVVTAERVDVVEGGKVVIHGIGARVGIGISRGTDK